MFNSKRPFDQMTAQTVPLRARSGQIYRFRVTGDLKDLPKSPGVFCFTYPQEFPGGPIEPVYWGRAISDFNAEVAADPILSVALRIGATHVGTFVSDGRIARKRIFDDLVLSFPPAISAAKSQDEQPSRHLRKTASNF